MNSTRRLSLGLLLVAAATVSLLVWSVRLGSPTSRDPDAAAVSDEHPVATTTRSPTASATRSDPEIESLQPSELESAHVELATIALSGRVVDEAGHAVAGATIWGVPDVSALRAMSHPLGALDWSRATALSDVELVAGLSLATLPTAVADADGRFRLELPETPRSEPAARASDVRSFPELIAHRDGFQPVLRILRNLPAGDADVGDLLLVPGATLGGRCVDETGQPIEGVAITVWVRGDGWRTSGDHAQQYFADPAQEFEAARSAADGRFALRGLRASPESTRLSFEFPAYMSRQLELLPPPGSILDLGDVVIERGPVIAGRVLDARGQPLAGAEVRVSTHHFEEWQLEGHHIDEELHWARIGHLEGCVGGVDEREAWLGATSTGADGTFRIGGLVESDYDVYAAAPGHEPQGRWQVVPGTLDLDFRLEPRVALTVRLLDAETEAPVTDATLRVVRAMSWFPERAEALGVRPLPESGSNVFLLKDVCPAPLAVIVQSESHGRQILALDGLALDAPIEERVLRVPLGASVAGTVVDESARPIADARVELSPEFGEDDSPLLDGGLPITTAADGAFHFRGMTPARWTLRAGRPGFVSSSLTLALAPGEARVGETIALTGTGRIEGRITGPTGLLDAWYHLFAVGQDPQHNAMNLGVAADKDGRYVIEAPPGRWVVQLEYENGRGKLERSVQVVSRETVPLDLHVPEPATLSGRVTASGRPLAGATLLSGKLQIATTDADGHYSFNLPAGLKAELRARSPGGGLSAVRDLELPVGLSAVVDLAFGDATLKGQVVDNATGRPVAGARVNFSVRGGLETYPPYRITDDAGGFTVEHVLPGEWRCNAYHDEYDSLGMKLFVPEQGPVPDVRIAMARGASISGVVRTASGSPTAYPRTVSAWPDDEEAIERAAVTQGGGYRIVHLKPGKYTVFVTRDVGVYGLDIRKEAEAIAKATAVVELTQGQELVIDLVLPPGEP